MISTHTHHKPFRAGKEGRDFAVEVTTVAHIRKHSHEQEDYIMSFHGGED